MSYKNLLPVTSPHVRVLETLCKHFKEPKECSVRPNLFYDHNKCLEKMALAKN